MHRTPNKTDLETETATKTDMKEHISSGNRKFVQFKGFFIFQKKSTHTHTRKSPKENLLYEQAMIYFSLSCLSERVFMYDSVVVLCVYSTLGKTLTDSIQHTAISNVYRYCFLPIEQDNK